MSFYSNGIPINYKQNGVYSKNYIYTIIGNNSNLVGGYISDYGTPYDIQLNGPSTITFDVCGNLFILDAGNSIVRFMPFVSGTYYGQTMASNYIYKIAGGGTNYSDNIPAINAKFNSPNSISVDLSGNIFICDSDKCQIRFMPKVSGNYYGQTMTANYIYTIVNSSGLGGYNGDNITALSAQIDTPYGVFVDSGGNIFIADFANYIIRFIPKYGGSYYGQTMTANYIYTIIGIPVTYGYIGDNILATNVSIGYPLAIFVDSSGNVFFCEFTYNDSTSRIRFIPKTSGTYYGQSMTANYIYTILYVSGNAFNNLFVDSNGNIFVSGTNLLNNNKIMFVPKADGTYYGQSMKANTLYNIAGNGTAGFSGDENLASLANLNTPNGIYVDYVGNIYFADSGNQRIRFIFNGDAGSTLFTIAGNGIAGYSEDDVLPTNSKLNYPLSVNVDNNGNLFIADTNNHMIRFIPKLDGTYFGISMTGKNIYKLVGTGVSGITGTVAIYNGVGDRSDKLFFPRGICIDPSGNVLFTNTNYSEIKCISVSEGYKYGLYMFKNNIYTIVSGDTNNTLGINALKATTSRGTCVRCDLSGNIFYLNYEWTRVLFIPKTSGSYYNQNMTANYVYALAGNGGDGNGQDNVLATNTTLNKPEGIAIDNSGNIFIADTVNNRIRFVPKTSGNYYGQTMTANYIYTIISGLNRPRGVCVDSAGNVFVSDTNNNQVKFMPNSNGNYYGQVGLLANTVYIIVGTGTAGYSGDGGLPTNATIWVPYGLFVDSIGNLYFADYGNHCIRYVPNNGSTITTIAGIGSNGGYSIDNIPATTAKLYNPSDVCLDSTGNIYIVDYNNCRIRFIPKINGTYFDQYGLKANYIYTIAGKTSPEYTSTTAYTSSFARITYPTDVTIDGAGTVFISSKFTNGAGTLPAVYGSYFGTTISNNFLGRQGGIVPSEAICVDKYSNIIGARSDYNILYVNTRANGTYYGKVMNGDTALTNSVIGFSGDGGSVFNAKVNTPMGVCTDSDGNIFISDSYNHRIRFVPFNNGDYYGQTGLQAYYIYTIVGNGTAAYSGDGGPAINASLNLPKRICVDSIGNLFIADCSNNCIRFVPKVSGNYYGQTGLQANYIYTIAGNGIAGYSGDVYPATQSKLNAPSGVCVDYKGTLYIADTNNQRIRVLYNKYYKSIFYTVVGRGSDLTGSDICGNMALLNTPNSIFIDSLSNIFLSDSGNNRLRVVSNSYGYYYGQFMKSNYIYTIAGNGSTSYNGDGISAITAAINFSNSIIFIDILGNIFIAEKKNHRIRFIPKRFGNYYGIVGMKPNYIYTIAGTGSAGYTSDSIPAIFSKINSPSGIWVDYVGNIFISDTNNQRIRFIPKISGSYYGQAMTANYVYTIAGTGVAGYDYTALATNSNLNLSYSVFLDANGNIFITEALYSRVRFVPNNTGTYYGQSMIANYLYTIAGNGNAGYSSNNVIATSSQLNNPRGVFVDSNGNIFIADTDNHLIRFIPKISGSYYGQTMTANYIYTVAGYGNSGGGYSSDNVIATSSKLNSPGGVFVDLSNNIFIADTTNNRIRFVPKISGSYYGQTMTANYIYTVSGTGTGGYSSDNVAATSSKITNPFGVYVDSSNNIFIADTGNQRIRFVPKISGSYYGQTMTQYYIYTVAGNGDAGYSSDNVAATSSKITNPLGVYVDSNNNIFIADAFNYRIRFVPNTSATYYGQPMTQYYIYTVAGNGSPGYSSDNVAATSSKIYNPFGVFVDLNDNIFIADAFNYRIRLVPNYDGSYYGQSMTANYIYTVAGTGNSDFHADSLATSSQINNTNGIYVDSNNNIFIADTGNQRVRFIPNSTGTYYGQSMTKYYLYSIAGNGTSGYSGDNTTASSSQLNNPGGVFLDSSKNIFITDTTNHRIRFVPNITGTYYGQSMTQYYIYTVAGNGTGGYSGDNTSAISSMVNSPNGVFVDSNKNICIADTSNNRIRFVPYTTGTYYGQTMTANYIYTVAGTGTSGYNVTLPVNNVPADTTSLSNQRGFTFDSAGNMFIADTNNHRIRFVPKISGSYYGQTMTANYIYTIAGTGTGGYSSDNIAAVSSNLKSPYSVCVDSDANIFIADAGNNRIRFIPKISGTYYEQIMTANYIYTIAGTGTGGYSSDNILANTSQLYNPTGVFVDLSKNLFISDTNNHLIRFVPYIDGNYYGQNGLFEGYIYTIAGTGTGGYSNDNVLAYTSNLNSPSNTFVDSSGNIFISDTSNNRIRFIPKASGTYYSQTMTVNYIYTIAGNGGGGYTENGGNYATNASLNIPTHVFVDSNGNVFIADYGNHVIRIVPNIFVNYFEKKFNSNYIYTIAGIGSSGYDGNNLINSDFSKLYNPYCVYVDSAKNIYISDMGNNIIRCLKYSNDPISGFKINGYNVIFNNSTSSTTISASPGYKIFGLDSYRFFNM